MDAATLSLYDRAAVIPGRSLTRSKKGFGKFAAYGDGAIVVDSDGQSYIDMLCGLGAISLGYREFMEPQCAGVYSFPHVYEVEAAEAVLKHVTPWASYVRFTKTGSEATHAAYRIAKAATGRTQGARCVGSYHGWHEWCDTELGTLVRGEMPPSSEIGSDVAAIIVEPKRFEVDDCVWLKNLRGWCDIYGALLIFDSMIYGGRFALGGASEYFGVIPDLECFGKALGNGRAVSFVVGTDRTREYGEIASGTFSGETSGLAAIVETLKVYTSEPVIETMWARGKQLRDGLDRVIPSALGTPKGFPVCQTIDWAKPEYGPKFSAEMLQRGVIWHPVPVLTMFAHTEQHIETVIQAAQASAEAVLA